MLFGISFNLFWLISWIMLSSLCLWVAYRLEAARNTQDRRMQRIAEATCQAFEATCEFTFERKYPPVINHPKETEFARKVLSGLVGADNVKEFEPTMGAEDFSFFLQNEL